MPRIDQSLVTLRVLWVALMASVSVYVAVAWLVANQPGATPHGPPPAMVVAFAVVSLVLTATVPVLRRSLLPPRREAASLGEASPTEIAAAAASRLHTACILSWALAEAIGILGLGLSLVAHDGRYVVPFAALSLVNFALYFPRRSLLEAAARGATAR